MDRDKGQAQGTRNKDKRQGTKDADSSSKRGSGGFARKSTMLSMMEGYDEDDI